MELPYGSGNISCQWDPQFDPVVIRSSFLPTGESEIKVHKALTNPIGLIPDLKLLSSTSKIAIVVNDKTRPVPNGVLITPLLQTLLELGVSPERITFLIASGTHVPMKPDEFSEILPKEFTRNYRILAHNCDERRELEFIGKTFRGTPVWVSSEFYHSDLRIVVGDIEPHHFAGYSGGVKSAAIGLCGRETITANHKLLLDDNSTIGVFDRNPLRTDIEEIGKMIKVDLALNSVLDEQKKIISVFFGAPVDVLKAGINVIDQICRIQIHEQFDVVVSSAGGYPRDINLYQAQKAMTTAAQFCRSGGKLILVAECRDGIGSLGYEQFMMDVKTVDEVINKFSRQDFLLGAHKAFLTAKIQKRIQTYLYSCIDPSVVTGLLYIPIDPSKRRFNLAKFSKPSDRIAILPYATLCMPGL